MPRLKRRKLGHTVPRMPTFTTDAINDAQRSAAEVRSLNTGT